MAFTNFCCRSGGSNLNAGTRIGDTTEPGTSANFTYASGNWVASTGIFTVASGNPSSDGVAVGDFASVYANGSTETGFVGRVTARDTTTITVSLTAVHGTAPGDGTGTRTLKIGGAWAGPTTGSTVFPFTQGFFKNTGVNAAGDHARINMKNDRTYTSSSPLQPGYSDTYLPNTHYSGYSSVYDDLGQAIIDFGTSAVDYFDQQYFDGTGCSIQCLTLTGAATSLSKGGIPYIKGTRLFRVSVIGARGGGGVSNGWCYCEECEFINCGAAGLGGGFSCDFFGGHFIRCVFANNTGYGLSATFVGPTLIDCVFAGNSTYGADVANCDIVHNCDFYNNGSTGLRSAGATSGANEGQGTLTTIENCNFLKNGGYGWAYTGVDGRHIYDINNAYGSGTQANTSGQTNSPAGLTRIGTITYASGVQPWTDPDNGDFRLKITSTARGAGRGNFLQTTAYTGTIGYPDIGAVKYFEVTKQPLSLIRNRF